MTAYQLAGKIGKRKLTAHFRKLRKMYPNRYDYIKAGVRPNQIVPFFKMILILRIFITSGLQFPPIQPTANAGIMRRKKQPVSQEAEEATQRLDQMSIREKVIC